MSKYYKENKMAKNIDQVQSRLRDALATNINNILTTTNNTNDTNDVITITFVENKDETDNELCSSLGLASLSASPQTTVKSREDINFVGGSELPAAWLNFKWDLFKNPSVKGSAQLKINLNIVRQDGTQAKLSASLNSPHDRIWRGVDDEMAATEHWQLIRSEYQEWRRCFGPKVTDWRASKFYLPGKKESGDTVVFFREEATEYQVRLFYRARLLDYAIPKSSYETLSVKQIQGNQIATVFVGQRTRKLATADDWRI
jgi:hypothetical protein